MNKKLTTTASNEKHRLTGSRIRRVCTAVAAAVALSVPVAMTASPAQATASWKYYQIDGDRCYDAVGRDTDYNGRLNEVWLDMDNDCGWDTHTWDGNDSHPALDHIHWDWDENGRGETMINFGRADVYGSYDETWYDNNQDGYWVGPYKEYFATVGAPTSTYDGVNNLFMTMARIHGTVAW